MKRKSKTPGLKAAIEEADRQGLSTILFANINNGIIKKETDKNGTFMSIEDELKLINSTIVSNSGNIFESKSQDTQETNEMGLNESNQEKNCATSTPTSDRVISILKAKRSSAVKASANLSNLARSNVIAPSEIRQQRAKIAKLNGEQFDSFFEDSKKKVCLLLLIFNSFFALIFEFLVMYLLIGR